MIKDFVPPEKPVYRLPGRTAYSAIEIGLNGMEDAGQISLHDKFIGKQIANILSGGDTDILNEVDEDHILKLESNAIQTLFKEPKSQERIETLLETGKIIRN
jgi:3-hydroxyacyl-CoA dehydrogenase